MSLKLDFKELRVYRRTVFVVFVFCMMASFSFFAMRGMQGTSAASTAGFRAGNIISDAVMANYNSMSVGSIQNFLTSKNPCNNRDYNQYLYLKATYPNNDWHWDNGHFICLSEERFGDGEVIGSGQTAAEIIYQAAQDYRINPQVLLVLLQKEQGLITDTYPNKVQYRAATGFGCPDTAACSTQYYGFKNQVRNAASMFRQVLDGGWSNYPAYKTVYVQYNPQAWCGGTNVYIENRATSALYRYTPYQPNASALNAGYGTGDTCGAYGNRNFYLYFTDWFGSTQAVVDGEPITLVEGEYTIVSRLNAGRTLGLPVGGNNVQLTAINENDSRQRWRITQTGSNYYTITNVATGMVVDLQDANTNYATNIQAWYSNNSCAQQWKPYKTPDNYIVFESACMPGMVIDVSGAATNIGNNIHLWIANGGNVQKWNLRTGYTIADGVYTISTKTNSTRTIGVANHSTYDSANVQLTQSNDNLSQRWAFKYNSVSGYYYIINTASGKYLDLVSARTALNTNIQLYRYSGTGCAQSWKVVKTPDNSFTLVSACAESRAVDLPDGKTTDGNNIRLWQTNNADAEKWNIVAIKPVENGVYEVNTVLSNRKALDVADARRDNGANIQLFDTNYSVAQEWQITRSANNEYTLTNPNSGKVLDIADGRLQRGTNIQQFQSNNTCAQKWYIVDNQNGYAIISACNPSVALDLSDALTANGTNIQLFDDNNSQAQRWTFRRIRN